MRALHYTIGAFSTVFPSKRVVLQFLVRHSSPFQICAGYATYVGKLTVYCIDVVLLSCALVRLHCIDIVYMNSVCFWKFHNKINLLLHDIFIQIYAPNLKCFIYQLYIPICKKILFSMPRPLILKVACLDEIIIETM